MSNFYPLYENRLISKKRKICFDSKFNLGIELIWKDFIHICGRVLEEFKMHSESN